MRRKFKANALWLALLGVVLSTSSAHAGRFLSRDPKGMVDGPNVYGFCGGDPVNRTDPMGTDYLEVRPAGPNSTFPYRVWWVNTTGVGHEGDIIGELPIAAMNARGEIFVGGRAPSQKHFGLLKEWIETNGIDNYGEVRNYLHNQLEIEGRYRVEMAALKDACSTAWHSLPVLYFGTPSYQIGDDMQFAGQLGKSWSVQRNTAVQIALFALTRRTVAVTQYQITQTTLGVDQWQKGEYLSGSLTVTSPFLVPVQIPNLTPTHGVNLPWNAPKVFNVVNGKFVPAEAGVFIATPGQLALPAPTLENLIRCNYQRFVNEAWTRTVMRFNNGEIVTKQGQNVWTLLGQEVDRIARNDIRLFLRGQGIQEGPGQTVLINRWLRDPLGSGAYRIPDVRLVDSSGTIIFDATIGTKTATTPQVIDCVNFSGGGRVEIITPQTGW